MQKMREGYTTGSCAAAGVKAALLAYYDKPAALVSVKNPQNQLIRVPIKDVSVNGRTVRTVIVKDGGDDPDITNGIDIIIDITITDQAGQLDILAGDGVGTVGKAGLSVPVGQPAINPGPRRMIATAVAELLPRECGIVITVSIPAGRELAKRTLNPILGIEGGLSIIGTTGIVRPMSEEAFKKSLAPQISVAKAQGHDSLVFVPGKIGADVATERLALPQEVVIETSNFLGYMLEAAADAKVKQVLMLGHLGKLVKVAAGNFHTHNRVSDARLETIAAYLALMDAPSGVIRQVLTATTTEVVIDIIAEHHLEAVYPQLAKRASQRAMRYVFNDLTVGTAFVNLQGQLLGMDANATKIGEQLGWHIK